MTSSASYYMSSSSNQQPLTPPIPFNSYAGKDANTSASNPAGSSINTAKYLGMSANNGSGGGGGGGSGQTRFTPSLKVKTNELFYKWLSSKERTEQLKEAIAFIKNNNKIPKITDLETFKNVRNKKDIYI
jgi:hypothetical protein